MWNRLVKLNGAFKGIKKAKKDGQNLFLRGPGDNGNLFPARPGAGLGSPLLPLTLMNYNFALCLTNTSFKIDLIHYGVLLPQHHFLQTMLQIFIFLHKHLVLIEGLELVLPHQQILFLVNKQLP